REAVNIAPVGVHDVDLAVAVAVADEHDPAVGRPGGQFVGCCVVRQPRLPSPVGVHDVDLGVAIARAHERDAAPVPWERGSWSPPTWLLKFSTFDPSAFMA